MSQARSRAEIEAAFLEACHAELSALKPGNVHVHAPGHGMSVATFEAAAAAATPFIADPALDVGARIFQATAASFGATGLNANLGIVLLCVPLAKAAAETTFDMGLRRRLALILSQLTKDDADAAFAAIRLANPAGLGKVEKGDVSQDNARMTLTEAMLLAADRDRIANAYVTAYADIFDLALPCYSQALDLAAHPDLAVTALHMTLLAAFPDSHIARKWGPDAADAVMHQTRDLRHAWHPVPTPNSFTTLLEFDASLKGRQLNPGTTADLVVSTLFAFALSGAKHR